MVSETDYPEPAQIRKFLEEPRIADDIIASDLELLDSNYLRAGLRNVEYRFRPAYINIKTDDGEAVPVESIDGIDIDHHYAWDRAADLEIQEDFICITELVMDDDGELSRFDAFWLLDEIRVGCNRPEA